MKSVAIVGAGPAGLTAAISARKLGLEPVIYEQAPDLPQTGAGFLIHSNGLRVLDKLGVLPRLLPRIKLTQRMQTETTDGVIITKFDYGTKVIPHNYGAVVLREDLRRALFEAAIQLGVRIHFGHECTGIINGESGVRLQFRNGLVREHTVALACDGVNSRIRDILGMRARIVPADYVTFAGVSEQKVSDDCAREIWSDDGGYFGLCPLPEGRSFFYSRGACEQQVDVWLQHWRRFEAPQMVLAKTDLSKLVRTEFRELHLDRWYQGAVFFLGDAAHAMRPNLGQGANSSMVDALILTHLIAESRGDCREVGQAYETIRKKFVISAQQFARRIDALRSLTNPAQRTMCALSLRASQKIPFVNDFVMNLIAGANPGETRFFEAGPSRLDSSLNVSRKKSLAVE